MDCQVCIDTFNRSGHGAQSQFLCQSLDLIGVEHTRMVSAYLPQQEQKQKTKQKKVGNSRNSHLYVNLVWATKKKKKTNLLLLKDVQGGSKK